MTHECTSHRRTISLTRVHLFVRNVNEAERTKRRIFRVNSRAICRFYLVLSSPKEDQEELKETKRKREIKENENKNIKRKE